MASVLRRTAFVFGRRSARFADSGLVNLGCHSAAVQVQPGVTIDFAPGIRRWMKAVRAAALIVTGGIGSAMVCLDQRSLNFKVNLTSVYLISS